MESKTVIWNGFLPFFEGDIVTIIMKGDAREMLTGKITNIGRTTFRIDVSERYRSRIVEHDLADIDLISLEERTWA